ncbi:hypothetical protein DYB37_007307 [Aphanomyces astaci]|uniref:Serine-threonine/tyrosine-protein kinase catalytic domain-containing protein n=1 Tax=Aphanomyces astaci TaxID=112090 RepID=A0A3L6UT82_APHAT|nr:hypothetical protein DYB35_011315 [Aphanomyces astaci]RHZ19773.1 hypothetical protein DYB37_007307 [Aphanomyces astaci]RLN99675.1 hypothetical protein DYB28_004772 [Aphanomyces astaci]
MSFRERRGAPPALQMDDEYTEDEDGKSGGCPYETNVLEMSCDIGDTTFRKGRLAITISFSTLSNGVRGHSKAAPSSSVDDSTSKTVHNVYDKAQRHQILTEIQTLYSVDTPWLVGFYGAYFKDQALSLILQYCDRGSLDGLVIQILSGLQHLKEARHFHRHQTAKHPRHEPRLRQTH